ncbi:MAG: hypothetical protein PHH37_07640 [Paludibacter sp.]|nr:hypothetical protein [Paludibacter sp.]
MKKIKYQGGATKLIATQIAKKNKVRFIKYIQTHFESLIKQCGNSATTLNMEVVSFSSTYDFSEQVLSILSFIRYVGIPNKWVLFSDGTYVLEQEKLLLDHLPFLKIEKLNWENMSCLPKDTKPELVPYETYFLDYAKQKPLGKRLFYYLNYQVERPALFIDSDILFYKQACTIFQAIGDTATGWYLPDFDWGCLDSRYKEQHQKQMYQVNGGFFLFNQNISDYSDGLDFFKSLDYKYEYFSDQNLFHILFRSNHFMPFDPRIFWLNNSDQFDFGYNKKPEEMAIRHYTGPVRHKMWQRNWKWHLSLK